MAIRKNGSRFKDRNAIRRMHRQGYSLEQISGKTSITTEHIKYVIEQWDEDEEKAREQKKIRQQHEMEARIDLRKPAHAPLNLSASELESVMAVARQQVTDELRAQGIIPPAPVATADPAPETPADPAPEATADPDPEATAPKRRKRKVLEGSSDSDDPEATDGGPATQAA